LLISELLADNHDGLADSDGQASDWVEIFNPGPGTVDLEGWGLSDDADDPFRWVFPSLQAVPGELLLVFASGRQLVVPAGELHASFALDAAGEILLLTRPDGSLADQMSFGEQWEDISWGLSQPLQEQVLLGDGSPLRWALDAPEGWQLPDFDDSHWSDDVLGLGFDAEAAETELDNAALFKPTDQSSDGYGYTGTQAVDGELASFSHTGDADLQPWWSVDLEGSWWIDSIQLHNRQDCCAERLYNIEVEVLDEEGAQVWRSEVLNPVEEGGSPSSPGTLLEVTPGGVAGHALRVSKQAVNGAGSSEWLSLAEVQVMAASSTAYEEWILSDLQQEMAGQSAALAVRIPFQFEGQLPDRLQLSARYDDGFAAWLNGELVLEINLQDGAAASSHQAGEPELFAIDPSLLLEGENLLAVQGFNITADDDDFLLQLELAAQEFESGEPGFFALASPGEPNGASHPGFATEPSVDLQRGFYDQALVVTLSGHTPGSSMAYTTDGSQPTQDHGTLLTASDAQALPSAEISVDTTTVLRAVALHDDYWPSPVITHSYLFLEDVIQQPALPADLPEIWDGSSQDPVAADYEMDPEIVDDPAYHDDLLAGLRDIPSLCIAMDPDDLFGAENGIYVHSLQRGSDWERPGSVELILPDGSTGFQVDSGVRIHGYGWRYHVYTRKHAFRLEFRDEYGPRKLEYPLFPDAPVDLFDSIVLRCQGSRGWQDFRDPEQSQYLRDAFARDTARDMGKDGGHAIFVHLYLNGLYWGLYNPVERPDARFAEERFGGDDEDYDAINRRVSTNEAIDGDLVAYEEMLALADQGLQSDEAYAAIQRYIDIDDLIDYMLIHQYTVNRDGPEEYQHNNMRGVRRREEGAQFKFFVWDMEYSIWEATDNYNIEVDIEGSVSHVYAMLRDNAEFRARYAERAAGYLADGGALSAEVCAARWEARAQEIELAIVGESARWGDAARETPYTRDVEWADERQRLVTEFFPYRSEQLRLQLQAAGLMEP